MASRTLHMLRGTALILALAFATSACSSDNADPTTPSCAYGASATPESFTTAGGTGTITITTTNACVWTVSSNAPWLTFSGTPSGASSGRGTATVPFTVAPNASTLARSAIIATPGNDVSIAQSAMPCEYTIAPDQLRFGSDGGSKGITITTTPPCPWTAASDQPWLRVTSASSGSGSATLQVTADAYFGASSRAASVTVAGKRVNVTQDGTGCTLSIAPTTASIGSGGGSATIAVTANETCAWQAESENEWIAISRPESGSGNGTITYTVAPNNSPDERVGRIVVEGQTLRVTQAGG